MKPINFLKPVPPKRQKEVRMWIATSFLSIGGLILFMFLIFGAQLYFLMQTREECQREQGCPVDDSLFRTKQVLIEQKKQLDSQLKKQEQSVLSNRKKIETFQTICSNCSPCFQIKSLRMRKKEIEIMGVIKESKSVHTVIAQISQKIGAHLAVQSITAGNNDVSFTAKGTIS